MRRFTILSLMGLISAVAVGVAALRHPSALWANALFTLAGVVLIVALLAASLDRRRAFAIGFATCCGAYMTLAFTPWLADQVGPRLLTTAALDILQDRIVAPEPTVAPPPGGRAMMGGMPGGGMGMGGMGGPPSTRWESWTAVDRGSVAMMLPNLMVTSSDSYLRIGHALIALLCGLLGGLLARSFRGRTAED